MKLKFECQSGACRETGDQRHLLVLPAEMVLDDQNMATMFCPKCKERLKQSK